MAIDRENIPFPTPFKITLVLNHIVEDRKLKQVNYCIKIMIF